MIRALRFPAVLPAARAATLATGRAATLAAALAAALAVPCGAALAAPAIDNPPPPVSGAPADLPPTASRGEYLARAADCVACHTAPGGTPYAGGRAFKLPFGTIYATNITPDPTTGIGNWSDDAFVRALRDGVGSHGRLYPAMPFTSYTGMSRDDALAIKAYLFTLPKVALAPPANTLVFPFNQRWAMTFWDLAFFRDHRFTPDPAHDASWNRGAYLATALGHCGECHTPRNIGFAMRSQDYMAGTITQGWKAYNTTSDATYGIGAWSNAQLSAYLWRGHAPGRSSASGPMAEVVEYSLQYLTPSDLTALVAYLRTVEPATNGTKSPIDLDPHPVQVSSAVLPGPDDAPNDGADGAHGQRLFAGDCAGCHQWNGKGRESDYASLVGSHAVNDPSGTALMQVLLHGSTLRVAGQTQMMPGFGGAYSNLDIASVANYVVDHFGGKQGKITPADVDRQRKIGS